MKKFVMLLIAVLTAGRLFAQTPSDQAPANVLKNKSYCAVSANGPVMVLNASNDSLTITYEKGSTITGRDLFKVNDVYVRGKYTLVYVKMDPSSLFLLTADQALPLNKALYGVFVFQFEKEDNKLLVVHDGRLWPTADEAKNAYDDTRLHNDYFNTWYMESRFAQFVKYPDFRNADEATVELIAGFWMKKLMQHREKKFNTPTIDAGGLDYGRDNLTKVLINNHLSPLATPADFNNKLKEYNIKITPVDQPTQTGH